MRMMLSLYLLLMPLIGHADVLEKIRFEDAIEQRLEHGLKEYDKSVHADVQVGYRKFESLPGTTLEEMDAVTPSKIDENDIVRIYIDIDTAVQNVTSRMRSKVYKLVPVNRNRLVVKFRYVPEVVPPVVETIKAKDISSITTNLAQQAGEFFSLLVGAAVVGLFFFAFLLQHRSLKMFRSQFENLNRTLSETTFGSMGDTQSQSKSVEGSTSHELRTENSPFAQVSHEFLCELMGDAYWCERDGYAHWVWSQLKPEQKRALLDQVAYMKDYAAYFLTVNPQAEAIHNHPYYLSPLPLGQLSQEHLGAEVNRNPGLWHALSPLRQRGLQLPLVEKLQIVQKKPKTPGEWKFNKQSPPRHLDEITSWGDISLADEAVLFNDPEMVPTKWQKNLQTLVWLSRRDGAYIQDVLARHDARALASAWVGSPEVLALLETHLPEKKLRLLQTYREKITPSKNSSCYQSLVQAGWASHEAA